MYLHVYSVQGSTYTLNRVYMSTLCTDVKVMYFFRSKYMYPGKNIFWNKNSLYGYYSQTGSKDHLYIKTTFYRCPWVYFPYYEDAYKQTTVYKDHILFVPMVIFIYKFHCIYYR